MASRPPAAATFVMLKLKPDGITAEFELESDVSAGVVLGGSGKGFIF